MECDNDIAIVGVGCCFPGADNLEEFWRVLVNGENHVVDIPESRWNNEAYYSADKDAPGKTYVRKAGLLKNQYEWDNRFFGISDAEAARIEPQQRYVLECVHMALEDGGIPKSSIDGSNTGVYIGCMNDDYKIMVTEDEADMTSYSATGMTTSIIAARVSYVYNLHGPCLTLDTACSSSLVAIHLGCQALRTGDAQMTICGGVSSIISPKVFIALSKARMMSSVGQCQSFADTADGYARGEGCGIVILKKLKDAIRDKNKIWGIVRTGCNQDGHMAQPITAPSGEQQRNLLNKVYENYGMDPKSVQYIEAHGTGTPTGDPTELNALGEFFGEHRKSKEVLTNDLLVGSVKSNIGHTESAAGIAGLIKILLMMHNKQIVPSLHINRDKSNINKKLNLETHGLDIALHNVTWDPNDCGQRIACVNSFGFGGSNSHAIVISPPSNSSQNTNLELENENVFPQLFCITATDTVSLEKNINAFVQDISETTENLRNISLTSMVNRDHMCSRVLLYGYDAKSVAKCASGMTYSTDTARDKANHNVVFVFCGVGTTWTGMCRKMMYIQAFRDKVKEIDTYLKPLTGWNISEKFENDTSYDDPLLNHIAIFATQIALASVWSAWGIKPDLIIGQSVGEVAASCVSGIIPLSEGVRIIYHRSKVLSKVTGGAMMVVGNKSVSETTELCKMFTNVAVAVYSSPVACTVSGNSSEIYALKEELQKEIETENKRYLIRELKVKCAYHSPLVEGCRDELIREIGKIKFNKTFAIPIISTVYGDVASENHFTTAEYWAENVCKPVMFYQSVAKSAGMKQCVFLEIGPRPVLEAHIQNIVQEPGICLPSMRTNKEFESLCSALQLFFQMGKPINWHTFCENCDFSQTVIPRYRFNKSKIIRIGEKMQKVIFGIHTQDDDSHMFVRRSISESGHNFEIAINRKDTPFVYDHTLSNTILVPGATYIEAAFKIGTILLNRSVTDLVTQVDFQRPVTPSTNGGVLIPISIQPAENLVEFVCSNNGQIVSKGSVYLNDNTQSSAVTFDIDKIKGRCPIFRNKIENYECLQKLQFQYGPSLSLMENSWASEDECIVELVLPGSVERQLGATVFHPAVIDGVFQIFGIMSRSTSAIPEGVDKVVIHGTPQRKMYAYACITKTTSEGINMNALLLSEMGHVLLEILDFQTREIKMGISKHLQHKISHIKMDALTKPKNKSNIFVLNMTRTSSRIHEVICEERCVTFGTSVQEINTDIVDDVVFLGVETDFDSRTEHPYSVFTRYNALKEVVLKLAEFQIEKPLYVLTENCQLGPGRKDLQLKGSEYWGLVRALRHENLLPDIRLLDIDPATVTSQDLISVITNVNTRNAEICMTPTGTYGLVFKEWRQTLPRKRLIAMGDTTNAILCSPRWNDSSGSFYKDIIPIPNVANGLKVAVNEFALHDKRIYTTSVRHSEAFLHSKDESGFAVAMLEGKGTVVTNNERSEDVVFCHPAIVTRPFVMIPEDCTISLRSIPFYFDGMLSMLCILCKLASAVPMNSKVIVVHNEKESGLSRDIVFHQLDERHCYTIFVSNTNVQTESIDFNKFDIAVILTYVTETMLQNIWCGGKTLNGIVTLSYLLTENLRIKLQMRAVKVVVVDTCDVFMTDELKNTVQKVAQAVRKLKHLESESLDGTVGNIELPFQTQTLSLHDGTHVQVDKNGLFHKNACYIVVGGLTGLGRLLVEYIAEIGGGHIAIFSRRSPSTQQIQTFKLTEVRNNCKIHFAQVDVSDLSSLERSMNTLEGLIGNDHIRGIFHGAGVLSDGLFINQTEDSVRRVFDPKVNGSWNLHIVSEKRRLDYFVLQSSVVSILGNAGQTSYAAANSFLDSLAAYRRSLGLCGQSINWGALSVGMAIDTNAERVLKQQGLSLLSSKEIKESFLDALISNEVQSCYVSIDWNIYERQVTGIGNSQNDRNISRLDTPGQFVDSMATVPVDLSGLDDIQIKDKVTELVREQICKAFVVADEDLKNETKFGSLGVDSMSAMSFVNSVYKILNVKVSIVQILSEESNVESIVVHILQSMEEQRISKGGMTVEFLDDPLTFMQESVIEEYLDNKDSISLINLVELEIKKSKLTMDQWKTIFRRILMMHPQLSLRIISEKHRGYKVSMFTDFEHLDEITEVSLPQMIQQRESGADLRKTMLFNLENERPIKCHLGIGTDVTVLRISIHKVISDLYSMSLFFQDLSKTVQLFATSTNVELNIETVDIPKLMKQSLSSIWNHAERFWNEYFKYPIQPITMGNTLEKPRSDHCGVVRHIFQKPVVEKIASFLRENNITLFQLVTSLYQILLHIETSQESVVVVTAVDMRVYVPGLSDVLARCVNVVPLMCTITDTVITDTVSLKEFILQNASHLTEVVKFGFYPSKLIYSNLKSKKERDNVGRHFVVLNKMNMLNDVSRTNQHYSVNVTNITTRRFENETALYILFNLDAKELEFELYFNSAICGADADNRLMATLLGMLDIVLSGGNQDLKTLQENASQDSKFQLRTPTARQFSVAEGVRKTESSSLLAPGGPSVTNRNTTDSPERTIVLLKGIFQKQTSHGWYHTVYVNLVQTRDNSMDTPGLLLRWSKGGKGPMKSLNLLDVRNIQLRKLDYTYNIVLVTSNRLYVLSTYNINDCEQLLQTIKTFWTKHIHVRL